MVLHIGIEHQPVYPASIIAVLGEEPILRLSTNVQTFPLTKNNCDAKPHGRQKLNNKNMQQTKLANNSHNIHEKYVENYTYLCPKNQPIFHIFPWP